MTSDKLIGHFAGQYQEQGQTEIPPAEVDPTPPGTPQPASSYILGYTSWHENTLITMQDGTQKAIKNIVVGDRLRTMAAVCSTSGKTYDWREAINPADTSLVDPKAVNAMARYLPPEYVDLGNGQPPFNVNYWPVANTESYSVKHRDWRPAADITWVAGEATVAEIGVGMHVPSATGGIYENFFLYSIRSYYAAGNVLMFTTMEGINWQGYDYGSVAAIEDAAGLHNFAARSMKFAPVTSGYSAELGDPIGKVLKPTAYPLGAGWDTNTSNFVAVASIKKAADGGGAWLTAALGRYYSMNLRRGAVGPSNASPCIFVNGYLAL